MNATATSITEGLRAARKTGIKRLSDLQALIHLSGVERENASNLATVAGICPAAATEMIDRLAKAALVTRYNGSLDRRLVLTSITAAGRELVTPFLP